MQAYRGEKTDETVAERSVVRLFLLPFAGANVNSYRGLETALNRLGVATTTLELPGHGVRSMEPLLTEIDAVEEDFFDTVNRIVSESPAEPFALFGHSMGALAGYRLALRLVRENLRPQCLIVSGRAAPSVPLRRARIHSLPQNEFIEEVRRLGGSPEEVLRNRELMEYFEPILRADFKAVETYEHEAEPALPLPISVLLGSDDSIPRADAERWYELNSGATSLTIVPGGHFYLLERPDETAQRIRHSIDSAL